MSAKNAKASYKFCHSYENVTMHFDKKLDKNEVSKKEMDAVYQWISGLKHSNKISNKNVYELHDENNWCIIIFQNQSKNKLRVNNNFIF